MRNWLSKSGLNLLFTLLVLCLIYVALFPDVISNFSLPAPNMDKIQTFKTMLISIVLEALPYILIGHQRLLAGFANAPPHLPSRAGHEFMKTVHEQKMTSECRRSSFYFLP